MTWRHPRMRARLAIIALGAVLGAVAAMLIAGCAVPATTTQQPGVSRDYPEDETQPVPATSTATPPVVSPQPTIPGVLTPVADEGHLTQTIVLRPGECRARDDGRLPDARCTPGSVDPAVTQATIHATICVTGWTATVRPPSSETSTYKFDPAYPAYGILAGTVSELDHLVPLELGGSNDSSNLWPETGPVPNVKDPVEGDLRADVCAGELTLVQAQAAIAADWLTVP